MGILQFYFEHIPLNDIHSDVDQLITFRNDKIVLDIFFIILCLMLIFHHFFILLAPTLISHYISKSLSEALSDLGGRCTMQEKMATLEQNNT